MAAVSEDSSYTGSRHTSYMGSKHTSNVRENYLRVDVSASQLTRNPTSNTPIRSINDRAEYPRTVRTQQPENRISKSGAGIELVPRNLPQLPLVQTGQKSVEASVGEILDQWVIFHCVSASGL